MRVLKNKTLTHTAWGSTTKVELHIEQYPNGRLGLQLMCPMEFPEGAEVSLQEEFLMEPYMTASVNLPDEELSENEVFIKDYSENEGITEYLIRWGVIERRPTRSVNSGFVGIHAHRLTAYFMMEIAAVMTEGKRVT